MFGVRPTSTNDNYPAAWSPPWGLSKSSSGTNSCRQPAKVVDVDQEADGSDLLQQATR